MDQSWSFGRTTLCWEFSIEICNICDWLPILTAHDVMESLLTSALKTGNWRRTCNETQLPPPPPPSVRGCKAQVRIWTQRKRLALCYQKQPWHPVTSSLQRSVALLWILPVACKSRDNAKNGLWNAFFLYNWQMNVLRGKKVSCIRHGVHVKVSFQISTGCCCMRLAKKSAQELKVLSWGEEETVDLFGRRVGGRRAGRWRWRSLRTCVNSSLGKETQTGSASQTTSCDPSTTSYSGCPWSVFPGPDMGRRWVSQRPVGATSFSAQLSIPFIQIAGRGAYQILLLGMKGWYLVIRFPSIQK